MSEKHICWDKELYEGKHSFVYKYGEELIQLLDPRPGENILDLGCGTGYLTAMIAAKGCSTLGIDASPEMIAAAGKNFSNLNFEVMDASGFTLPTAFDAVFSNAVLHWVFPPAGAVESMFRSLRPGGRLVAEFGGKGNNEGMLKALKRALIQKGHVSNARIDLWYFPSIPEYTSLLEQHGFETTYATLFERPTPLEDPEDGVKEWFRMFGSRFFAGIPPQSVAEVLELTEAFLRPTHFRDGHWVADYKRIRIMAVKPYA
jgi:SAM-dependent methyltransferase